MLVSKTFTNYYLSPSHGESLSLLVRLIADTEDMFALSYFLYNTCYMKKNSLFNSIIHEVCNNRQINVYMQVLTIYLDFPYSFSRHFHIFIISLSVNVIQISCKVVSKGTRYLSNELHVLNLSSEENTSS